MNLFTNNQNDNLEKKKKEGLCYIFLVDIEGFTKLSSSLSHNELSNFVDNFKNSVLDSVNLNEGKVIKFLGDGAIAVFNLLEKAIGAADILISRYSSSETKVKVFITVGEVIFEDNDIFGLDVNFAFRVIEAIKGGTLAISEPTYMILKNKQGFSPSRELSIKGVGDGIRIFVRGEPEKLINETDDVRFLIKSAGIWDRFISFYLDVLIFISSFGIISTITFKKFIQMSGERQITEYRTERNPQQQEQKQKKEEELKLLEIETPLGKIKAGKGELDIKTQRGEVHTEPGKLEIKLGEGKKFAISYLQLSGIEVVIFTLYLALFWFFFKGMTPGEWIVRIRVERLDRSPPDLRTSFLRAILLVFMVLPAGLGVIIPLIITRGKTFLHDNLTKTVVVRR